MKRLLSSWYQYDQVPFSKLNGGSMSKGNDRRKAKPMRSANWNREQVLRIEVATTQVVNTQNTIPSKFTRIGRKATAPANPLEALQKYIFVISIPPSPQIR